VPSFAVPLRDSGGIVDERAGAIKRLRHARLGAALFEMPELPRGIALPAFALNLCLHNCPMMQVMDWLTTLPLLVAVIGELATATLQALADRLLTIVSAVVVIGGVSVSAVTAAAGRWLKHAIAELHATHSLARH
jgi:hypothetical protein